MRTLFGIIFSLWLALPALADDTITVTCTFETQLYSSQADNNSGSQTSPTITSAARRMIWWSDSTWIDSVDAVITPGDQCVEAFFQLYFYSMAGTGDDSIFYYPMWKIPLKEYTYADSASAAASNGFNPANDSTPTWNDWANDNLEWGTAGCNSTQDLSGSTNYFNQGDGTGADRTAAWSDAWLKTGGTTYNAFDTVAIPATYVNIAYAANSGVGIYGALYNAFTATFSTAETNSLRAARLTVIYATPGGGGGGETGQGNQHTANSHTGNRHGG